MPPRSYTFVHSLLSALAVLALAPFAPRPAAAQSGAAYAESTFTRSDAHIAMRDGVQLYTVIFTPKKMSGPLPIIFTRTPYGVDDSADEFTSYLRELADEGYIFAFQDIRGRFSSDGKFVMQRAPRDRNDPKAIDESTDAYDSIDWLVKNVANNNGKVGMLGISYPGWLTAMAMLDQHPALAAVSPQASPADMFIGDDFHHNGAFRLSYGFEYASEMESTKENSQFPFEQHDTYDWYLALGPLSNANAKYFHGRIPSWNDFVNHPNYDAFWKKQAMAPYLDSVRVPTLNVAGWWDQEDFYGPVKIYSTLEPRDRSHRNFLVVVPWNHGGWSRPEGRTLGNIDFGSATSKWFRDSVQAPWFAYWLKDKGKLEEAEAVVFEGGSNRWRRFDAWPPTDAVTKKSLHFQANGKLSFDSAPAKSNSTYDSYVSDPAHPVPYRNRPVLPTYYPGGSGWTTWLTEDQRFVNRRPDVLSWQTDPLPSDVSIAGDIIAHLFASTTGTDADWVVKLIDVYPDRMEDAPKMSGYQFMVANDVFRGRFRKSFEKPSPITANTVQEYTIDLHTQSYRFLAGHRIMVQVQSSWFPIIDRNPQTYVASIFQAKQSDFRPATERIYRTSSSPSHVSVEVVP